MVRKKWQKKYKCNRNRRCFDVIFKLKVLEEAKIPHEIGEKEKG